MYFILVHIISNCVSRSGLILQLGQVISVLIWRGCDVKPSWKNQSEKTVQSEEIGSNAVKIINLRKLFQIISGKYYFYILIRFFACFTCAVFQLPRMKSGRKVRPLWWLWTFKKLISAVYGPKKYREKSRRNMTW